MPTLDKEKDEQIRKLYFGPDGFRSQSGTYQDARTAGYKITLAYVRDWFKRNFDREKQVSGTRNSYVAKYAGQQIQADIFYITENYLRAQEYPFGLSAIDIFSKKAAVIPMKERKFEDVAQALLTAFNKIGKQPDVVFTDDEGALNNKEASPWFGEMGIQHIASPSKAKFVERFNRTFRGMLFKHMNGHQNTKRIRGKTNLQWHDFIPAIINTYNTKMVHSATGLTPVEAARPGNEASAKASMEVRASHGRKFPPLEEGNKVRIVRQKKLGDKEHMNNFRAGTYEVVSISENLGQKYYKLSDGKEYIRSDIVKMER